MDFHNTNKSDKCLKRKKAKRKMENLKVLILDGDTFTGSELGAILPESKSGITFLHFHHIPDASCALSGQDIRFALVDPNIPGERTVDSGIRFLETYAKEYSSVGFFLHARERLDPALPERLRKLGVKGYINRGTALAEDYLRAFGFSERKINEFLGDRNPVIYFE